MQNCNEEIEGYDAIMGALDGGPGERFAVGFDGTDESEPFESFETFDTGAEHGFAIGDSQIAVGGFFGDIVHAVSNVTKAATHAVAKGMGGVANLAGKIPFVGAPLHTILGAASGPFRLADSITHGARLDRAVLGNFKEQLTSAREIAPYAQTIVSFVPGIGSGVAGAIAAGSALAQGRPITDIAMAAVRGALPGGALAQSGFDLARKVASGANVAGAALAAARDQLPAAARSAFDVGLAMTQGRKMQDVLVQGIVNLSPAGMAPLAQIGQKLAMIEPAMRTLRGKLSGAERIGFDLVNGTLAHSGVPEHAMLALRQRLGAEAKRGFDAALAVQAKKVKSGALRNVPVTIRQAAPIALASAAPFLRAAPRSAPFLRDVSRSAPFLRAVPQSAPSGMGPVAGVGNIFSSVSEAVARAQGARASLAARGAQGRAQGGAFGGMFAQLLRKISQAKRAQSQGHPLTRDQIRLLASFRKLHARAKSGHPRARSIMALLRAQAEAARARAGRSAGGAGGGGGFGGGGFGGVAQAVARVAAERIAQEAHNMAVARRGVSASGWAPDIRGYSNPTGTIFVGAEAARHC